MAELYRTLASGSCSCSRRRQRPAGEGQRRGGARQAAAGAGAGGGSPNHSMHSSTAPHDGWATCCEAPSATRLDLHHSPRRHRGLRAARGQQVLGLVALQAAVRRRSTTASSSECARSTLAQRAAASFPRSLLPPPAAAHSVTSSNTSSGGWPLPPCSHATICARRLPGGTLRAGRRAGKQGVGPTHASPCCLPGYQSSHAAWIPAG